MLLKKSEILGTKYLNIILKNPTTFHGTSTRFGHRVFKKHINKSTIFGQDIQKLSLKVPRFLGKILESIIFKQGVVEMIFLKK